jgi:hypothetical protein
MEAKLLKEDINWCHVLLENLTTLFETASKEVAIH